MASRISWKNAPARVEGDSGARELDRRGKQLAPGEGRVPAVPSRARRAPRARRRQPGRRGRPGSCARRTIASTGTASAARPGRQPCPGTAAKKSSRPSILPFARWTSMKPPPPGPVSGLSATQETKAAAMQPSTALPPSARIRAPASAVSGVARGNGALHGVVRAEQGGRGACPEVGQEAGRLERIRAPPGARSPWRAGRSRSRSRSPTPGRRAVRRSSRRR